MRRLTRGAVPAGLGSYRHGLHEWRDLCADDKRVLWEALEAMQGQWCAYCERRIGEGRRHIEHFRPQHSHPRLAFDWGNLFGSCMDSATCGHHKDRRSTQPYQVDDLIKPDEEDPDAFFVFVADGSIAIREGLTDRDRHRAAETLRVFGLDVPGGRLRQMRRAALTSYIGIAAALEDLVGAGSDDEFQGLVDAEIAAAANEQFGTAIRHLLGRQGATAGVRRGA